MTTSQAICFELLRLLLLSLRFASCFECFEGPIGPEARSKIAKQAQQKRMADTGLKA